MTSFAVAVATIALPPPPSRTSLREVLSAFPAPRPPPAPCHLTGIPLHFRFCNYSPLLCACPPCRFLPIPWSLALIRSLQCEAELLALQHYWSQHVDAWQCWVPHPLIMRCWRRGGYAQHGGQWQIASSCHASQPPPRDVVCQVDLSVDLDGNEDFEIAKEAALQPPH